MYVFLSSYIYIVIVIIGGVETAENPLPNPCFGVKNGCGRARGVMWEKRRENWCEMRKSDNQAR